jgi:Ser/Thr protein kinase RdoA (MazF antagonist)
VAGVLAEVIEQEYGLTVLSVESIPGGYTALCFAVQCPNQRFVAKVWRSQPPGDAWVLLCESLQRRGLRVAGPIRSRTGAAIIQSSLGPLGLLPFLPGQTPPDWPRWPPQVLSALGAFFATVHATPIPLGLRYDDLAVPAPDLSNVDADLAGIISAQLARLRRMGEAIDPSDRATEAMVLCHADAYGDNVLVDDAGRVGILDWDDASASYPEADFILVARDQPLSGDPLRHVLDGYRARDLRLDRLAFLMLRRYLGDALARVDRMQDPRSSAVERRQARDGITDWGIRQWDRLDEALRPVARLLR